MAKALNKNRILSSKIALISTVIIVIFSRQYWPEESAYHEVFEIIGVTLVSICAMGRIYATAFLGGFKNEVLVTHGIYSLLRNPLYFFTLIGIIGISLISNHISVMIGLPLFFGVLYSGLINREQKFLEEKFGDEFLNYKKNVYALIPNFANYHAPSSIEVNPKFITRAFVDAIWWLSALPIIEFAEYLQYEHIVPVFFVS